MNSKAAIKAWESAAAEFTEFITVNRRQPNTVNPDERELYHWGLRHTSRMRRGLLNEHQEVIMNGILDLYESIGDPYPTKTPSLDGLEQFYAAHGRVPSADAGGEEAAVAASLKAYIRVCRTRDGFRADTLERLLAIPGAVDDEQLGSFQRALHILRTHRLPAGTASGIVIGGIRLNPATRTKRVPLSVPVPTNSEIRYADKWNSVFAEFTAWVDANGSLPRRRSTDPEEQRLANWLNVQRRNHRGQEIPPALEKVLASVPGALEPIAFKSAAQWYANIAAFYDANGRMPSCSAANGTDERSLAEYMTGRLRPALRSGQLPDPANADLARILAVIPAVRAKKAA